MAEATKAPELTMEQKIASMSRKDKQKRLEEVKREMAKTTQDLAKLMNEDRTGYAQGIIDKMFSEFKAGARWVERMQKLATEEYYVYSSLGRRRFLPAAMTGDQAIVSQQVRRGMNAPVQGMASEIGIKAGRCIMESYYRHLPKLMKLMGESGTLWSLRVFFNRVVHDANYLSVPYKMVIPIIHIMQWEATYGVTARYKEEFGLDFTVEPEIEIEIAAVDSKSLKWDWTIPNLLENLRNVAIDAEKIGQLESDEKAPEARVADVMEQVLGAWRNKEVRAYLQKHFPLLGEHDLDKNIRVALKQYDKKYPNG